MKKVISIILTVVMVFSIMFTNAFSLNVNAASSGTTGDCTWTLEGTVLRISGEGEMDNNPFSFMVSSSRNKITEVIIENGVTNIAANAFFYFENLSHIEIPSSIKIIGQYAFQGCSRLSDVDFPEGIISIGEGAFSLCSSLTRVDIPESLTYIGYDAFSGCQNLQSVYIKDLFKFCSIEIDEKGEGHGSGLLRNVKKLYLNDVLITDLVIPDGITEISTGLFTGYEALRSVYIPEGVTKINDYAFGSCKNIEDVYYEGYEINAKNITISSVGNSYLLNATWHYKSCADDEHDFLLNNNLTCQYCGYSLQPDKPIVESYSKNTVTLVASDIYEYSLDGKKWQSSSTFPGLTAGATYSFCQRVKASTIAYASKPSEFLVVYVKNVQNKPEAPIISSYTDTNVTLRPLTNGEYSIDGIAWQSSNVFENLLAGAEYTFYQRYAETDTHVASESSVGTSVTTDKSKQTLIPSAPIVQSVTASSITLVAVSGCEYSKNGTTWQSSNVFSSLSCGTEYTFYQRYKETTSTYVGKSSEGTIGKTDKGAQLAPSRPTLSKKTHNSVTLTTYSGYEYSMDGISWQNSNVFTGLNPETNYLFYQRKAETETYYASAMSDAFTVKTKEMYESISVSTLPNKISYLEGKDELDVTGGQIFLCYPDGTTAVVDITADMVTGFSNKVVGNQTLTVFYEGFTATFTVEVVAKSVVSIAITMNPNKLTYMEGEGFEQAGMVVMAYYNNGTSEAVTDYIISGYTSTPGSKTITVTYDGKTANFNVVVNAKPILGTWKYDGTGWWYQNANGTYPANCWKEIDNVWYYFNPSGYMVTGWQSIGGTWYYFNGSGAMLIGWQSIGGTWYYFASSGAMLTGWQSIGGTWYYFNGSGAMLKGWQSISGVWYYFEGSGAMVANRWIGNYYLQGDGTMATNKWIGSYYVGPDGVWVP